jgi:hypothetical protein
VGPLPGPYVCRSFSAPSCPFYELFTGLSFRDLEWKLIRSRVLLQGLTDIPILFYLSDWNLFVVSISILPFFPVLTSKDPLADNLIPLERAVS